MKRVVKTGAEIRIGRTETGVPENQRSKILYRIPVQNQIEATKKGQEEKGNKIANLGIL